MLLSVKTISRLSYENAYGTVTTRATAISRLAAARKPHPQGVLLLCRVGPSLQPSTPALAPKCTGFVVYYSDPWLF